jgi:hypothetical protein
MCEVAVKKAIIGFIPLAMTTWHSLVLGACFQITEASTESHPVSQSTSAVSNDKFVDLYNGKDLTGWQTKGNWIPQPDGSLLIEPRENETGWSRFDAYLWTTRKYKDFELRVEYAYPQNGNSGVYFRVADRHNPVATGIEAQIFDSSKHKGATTDHSNGGIIPAGIAPSQNMARPPGEWNRMIVRCAGDRLTVRLNGTEVVNVRLSKTALKDRQREGYIGLQDHGRPHTIRFRNIQIKEIAPSAPDAAQTFFDRKILPVFREKCIHCHGEDEQEGSLRLDSLVHVMRGGNSGEPVLVVGQDEESHLIHLVTTANKPISNCCENGSRSNAVGTPRSRKRRPSNQITGHFNPSVVLRFHNQAIPIQSIRSLRRNCRRKTCSCRPKRISGGFCDDCFSSRMEYPHRRNRPRSFWRRKTLTNGNALLTKSWGTRGTANDSP